MVFDLCIMLLPGYLVASDWTKISYHGKCVFIKMAETIMVEVAWCIEQSLI